MRDGRVLGIVVSAVGAAVLGTSPWYWCPSTPPPGNTWGAMLCPDPIWLYGVVVTGTSLAVAGVILVLRDWRAHRPGTTESM